MRWINALRKIPKAPIPPGRTGALGRYSWNPHPEAAQSGAPGRRVFENVSDFVNRF